MNGARLPVTDTHPESARVDAAEHPQERALAGAVTPDDGEHLAAVDVEADPVEHPERAAVAALDRVRNAVQLSPGSGTRNAEVLAQVPNLDYHGT